MTTIPPASDKQCDVCKQVKPMAEFDRQGRERFCKGCRREKRRAAYAPHPRPRIEVVPDQRFGKLAVIRETASKGHYRMIRCRCDCGVTKDVSLHGLMHGDTTSCGCYHREQLAKRNRERPRAHPLYQTWRGMMTRCYDERHKGWKDYGGRGIKVDVAWHDPKEFFRWIDQNLGPRPQGRTLDRRDNDGDYGPGKVRWATRSEQNRNRRCDRCSQYRAEIEQLREKLAALQ